MKIGYVNWIIILCTIFRIATVTVHSSKIVENIEIPEDDDTDIRKVTIEQHQDDLEDIGDIPPRVIKVPLRRENYEDFYDEIDQEIEAEELFNHENLENILNTDPECKRVFGRISTYESLSSYRANSLQELEIIDRLLDTLPERCSKLFESSPDLARTYNYQKSSIKSQKCLHSSSVSNRMPLYRWFMGGLTNVDMSEDCHKVAIKRALEEVCHSGFKGKVLPILRAGLTKAETDYYTEYSIKVIKDIECSKVTVFGYEDQLSFASQSSKLANYLRSHEIGDLDHHKIKELAKDVHKKDFKILLISRLDDGQLSPFTLTSYQLYSIKSDEGILVQVGKGGCQYNPQMSFHEMLKFGLQMFLLTIMLQPILRTLTIISIPETCRNTMSYLLCPIAFLLGLFLPYLINKICYFGGMSLPNPEDDFVKSLHWIFIVFAIVRYTPSLLLSTLCYRLNIYEEYVKEKWFMCLTILGGALGNIVWILLGLSINSSSMLEHSKISPSVLARIAVSFGINRDDPIIVDGQDSSKSDFYHEELNPHAIYDTYELILLSILFVMLAMASSFYQSDVLCGRAGLFGTVGSITMIISCNLSYAALLLTFSSYKQDLSFYISVGFISFIFAFLARATKYGRTGRKIDASLEAPEQHVIVDQEAKKFLINKNNKGMVTKLASKYGTPFVGIHKTIVRDIYNAASNDRSDHFFVFAISGRRGTGKTRIVWESFKKPERQEDFYVVQGEAGVKDDDNSKDMDLDETNGEKKQAVKIQKCQPFEPIRKAVGHLIGINAFSSPAQQLTAIKNATEFAESFEGLSFLFSVDNKEENEEDADSKQMNDIHVLAQSLSKMFVRMARKYHKEHNKKLVILFEDMEYADKNSLDMIRLLVKIFAASYKTVPIIIAICYRELPNSDDGENNEGKIQEIINVANVIAKRTGGSNKLKTAVNMLLDKQTDKLASGKKMIKDEEKIAKHYKLTGLTMKNLEQLLQSLAFIEEEVSGIATWLHSKSQGKLYWVSACLQNLFIEKYVESSLRGWKIVAGKTLREISVPNKMAKILEVKFRKMEPEELRVLQIAAECGLNFNSNLLAKLTDKTRIDTIYDLNSIQREYNVITENKGSALRNDQGNDTLSGEFTFSSIVYIDALKSLTRNYGNNLLYAKQIQLRIFDLLFSNVNMSQQFLNSFFFYMDKYEFENDQGVLEFSLEQRWGNAYIEIINFRKLPLEFKFRLAEHANDSCLERPFEALIAFTMAALTAKDLWDAPNIIKYCDLAINEARSILQNLDEIDELFEWLKKVDRCGFSSEDEILGYVRRILSELLIIESQNKIEADPKKHSHDIVEQLERLEGRLGKLPPKARVIKALAYAYLDDLEGCKVLSKETFDDPDVAKLYKADACYSACFAGYKSKNQEDWHQAIKDADIGVATMLEYIKEARTEMKSRKIRKQAKEIMGKLLLTKGMIYQFKLNNLKECEKCYIDALDYKQQNNDVLGCAKANGLLGKLHYTIGKDLKRPNSNDHSYSTQSHFNKGIKHYEQCSNLSQKIEEKVGIIESLKGLGNCNLELGKYDEALKKYESGAQRAIEFKNINQKVEIYCQIVKTHILKGDSNDEYKTYFEEVLRLYKDPKLQELPVKGKGAKGNLLKRMTKKQINQTHIKDLMQFIEDQKLINKHKEENKFKKLD